MDIEDVDAAATAGDDAGSVGNVDDFSNLASLDLDLADDFSPEVPAVTGEDDSQPVDTGDDTPPVQTPVETQELQQQHCTWHASRRMTREFRRMWPRLREPQRLL